MIAPAIHERAALICALCASNERHVDPLFADACAALGVDWRQSAGAANLAACARQAARRGTVAVVWADAEALLRTGWHPPAGWEREW